METQSKEAFREWLKSSTNFGADAIGDTISRVRRAEKICPSINSVSLDEYLYMIALTQEFKQLSPSVKSQIRRAAKLLFSFRQSK